MGYLVALIEPLIAFLAFLFSRTLVLGVGLAIAKLLAWLGIGYLTYHGTVMGVDYFVSIINDNLQYIPPNLRQLIYAAASDLRLDSAFSIVLSAYAVKVAMFTTSKITFNPSASV